MIYLLAPAKLNLYLRVLGKRPDGYHEIETLFERIDLADELTFEPAASGVHLTCTDPALSCGDDNLVVKAARLLERITQDPQAASEHSLAGGRGTLTRGRPKEGSPRERPAAPPARGATQGARIHLTKRIPIAAGLGGGSSDAAATLLGLNELWGLGLTRAQLMPLAAQLGSDVPCFLSPGAFAIGRGRGEVCEPVETDARLAHMLVTPNVQLSTKEVYEGLANTSLTTATPSINILLHALRNGPALAGLAEGLHNDLEPEAIRRCPVITRIQLALQALGCLGAHVSGSGPSVFGLCRDQGHAVSVVEHMRQHGERSWRVEVVRTDQTLSVGTSLSHSR